MDQEEEDQRDLERFKWLVENIQEGFLDKNSGDSEYFTDYRRIFKLPHLLSVNCIGYSFTFREAIDAKRGVSYEEEEE